MTFVWFLQGLLALRIIASFALLIVLAWFTTADLFASALAFTATGWCMLYVSTMHDLLIISF
jgi:callose synthase